MIGQVPLRIYVKNPVNNDKIVPLRIYVKNPVNNDKIEAYELSPVHPPSIVNIGSTENGIVWSTPMFVPVFGWYKMFPWSTPVWKEIDRVPAETVRDLEELDVHGYPKWFSQANINHPAFTSFTPDEITSKWFYFRRSAYDPA